MTDNTVSIMDKNTRDSHLEPRVAKLEAGLDILTKNVTDLTIAVRDNANNLEGKFERLTIAVTQAQAPKKTDWMSIITGLMLIMAIGSAVFWPLSQTSANNKEDIQRLEQKNEKEFDALDKKLQQEYLLMNETIRAQVAGVEKKQDIINEKTYKQIDNLEERNRFQMERDYDELRAWRLRSMNGPVLSTIPSVPNK